MVASKTCSRCDQEKPLSAFRKWVTRCRECENQARKKPEITEGHPRDLVRVAVPGWVCLL